MEKCCSSSSENHSSCDKKITKFKIDKTKIFKLKKLPGQEVYTLKHQLKFGSHVTLDGSLMNALQNNHNMYCCQVYLGSRQGYSCSCISNKQKQEIQEYFAFGKQNLSSFYVHCPLVAYSNLTREDVIQKSKSVVEKELATLQDLPAACVLHIGKACGHTDGINKIIENINDLNIPRTLLNKSLLLETAAGQGTEIGKSWEEIRHIYEGIDDGSRVGLCVDTQHVFAAGMVDLRSQGGIVSLFDSVDDINLKSINLIHLNDSNKAYESRVDRHQNLGKGFIWSDKENREALDSLLERLAEHSIDVILETPEPEIDLKILYEKY